MSYPTYFEAFDIRQLLRDYPVGDAFTQRYTQMSRDELFAIQNSRFANVMTRGWRIPFYQRLWGNAGSSPATFAALPTSTSFPSTTKRI
jgi:phenylacetate-CoA ligase